MSIYIINPSFIMKNHSKAHCFVKELKEQFDKYDISYSMVNNAAKYLSKIENDSIIIIFKETLNKSTVEKANR